MDQQLREMLEKDRLMLHYQLQYSANEQLRGMEAFLRLPDAGSWTHWAGSPDRAS